MKVFKIFLILLSVGFFSPATAMENAPDAVSDGRTVPLMDDTGGKNCTGFLYTEKIVLTAAHCLHDRFTGAQWPHNYVGMPGKPYSPSNRKVAVDKIFVSQMYKFKTAQQFSDVDDFAVMVLKEPIPVSGTVSIATQSQIDSYIDNNTLVTNFAYGRQGPQHNVNDYTVPKSAQFPLVPISVVKKVSGGFSTDPQADRYYGMKVHILQVPSGPSVCPSDSGSPFYVKEGQNFVYLGALSWAVGGAPLCTGNAWTSEKHYQGSVGAYDFLYLIKQAEEYVTVLDNQASQLPGLIQNSSDASGNSNSGFREPTPAVWLLILIASALAVLFFKFYRNK